MDRLQGTASVKMVYGEPIETKEKTIVPVAKVAYGFGAGSGSDKKAESTGGGGGGGIAVKPKGVLEITKDETRFISFDETRNLIVILMIGLFLGLLIGRRGSKR
jgi:uncharacterized spore protein YtfJ